VRRNHRRFEKTSAVRSEGSTVRLLDAGARAGLIISEHAFGPARAWIVRVPAAIAG